MINNVILFIFYIHYGSMVEISMKTTNWINAKRNIEVIDTAKIYWYIGLHSSFYILHACKNFRKLKINSYIINKLFKLQVFVV